MKRVCVVCEGQTEETFVREVLAPALLPLDLLLIGETIETSVGHKGGALNYDRVRTHLRNRLRQNSAPTVTTFFDLYRLDRRFPGFENAKLQGSLNARLSVLIDALHADVIELAQCQPQRFIPFIQPHEFEALLFSDVAATLSIEQGWSHLGSTLSAARAEAESPEHINDGPDTKPAARLEKALRNPSYRKARHGPIAAKAIGLNRIESECQFFAAWVARLRTLGET